MQMRQEPATLVLTLPRREFASGLIALGAVAQQEELEWQRARKGAPTLSKGDRVSFARLYGDRILHGTIASIDETSVWVRRDGSTDKFGFEDEQRAVVVPRAGTQPEPESRLSRALELLEAILGRIRSRSFCVRRNIGAIVLGNESRMLAEWEEFPISSGGSEGVLSDLLRPSRFGQTEPGRTACVSDRSAHFAPDRAGDALLMFDGERSWRRWSKAAERHRRVLIIDRSTPTFDSFIEEVQGGISGHYVSFANDLSPPPGVEAYAYSQQRRGRL